MPVSCAAYGCNSRNTLESRQQGVTFHRFPLSNKPLLQEWRLAMKRSKHNGELWMPSPYQRICSLHFEKQSFDETGQTRRLRSNAVPSIFNFPEHFEKLHRRQKGRKRKYVREDNDYDVYDGVEEGGEEGGGGAVGNNEDDDDDDVILPSASKDVLQNPHVEHSYSTPGIDSLKRKLQIMEKKLLQKMKELRDAKERERRPRETCGTLLRELAKKKLAMVTHQLMEKLQPYEDIPLELFDKSPNEYSMWQKSFVVMLQLHASSAYRYIRNHKLPFPSLRILRSWLKTTDDGPGISASILETLVNKRLANPSEYTCACLVIGALPLRQHVAYDACQKQVVGFVNFGNGPEAGSRNVATQALVFMLVGITGHWKAPIAHFLTNSLTAEAQKELVLHVLHELTDNGFDIKSITVAGCETNVQMCTILGCDFSDPTHLKTHFTIPGTTKSCYIVIDVCDEAGLLCDLMEAYESVKSNKGTITWQHIKDLKVLLTKSGIYAGTKSLQKDTHNLSDVEVSLAARILSSCIAKTLLRLHDLRYENFSESDTTAFFLQTISKLLAVFCSHSPRIKGYKGAVDNNSLQNTLGFLSEMREYLLSLTTIEGTMLYECPRKMCIVYFLINIQSFCEMLPELLTHQKYVLTYKFSQDFVKIFFNEVRAPELDHDPTASQLKYAIRKWFIRNGVNIGQVDNETTQNSTEFLTLYEERSLPTIFQQQLPSPFDDSSTELPDHIYTSETLNLLLNNPLVYVAGWVVRKAMTRVACDECRCALVSDTLQVNFLDAYHLLQLKDSGRLVTPSSGTVRIILSAEHKLRHMMNVNNAQYSVNRLQLEHEVLLDLGNCDVLSLSEHMAQSQCGIDNHYFHILRLLVSIFYMIRQQHIAKLEQWEVYKCRTKQKLTKIMITDK